jgi:serine/threonine protein kinase
MRETVTEGGGQATPCYSAPEIALSSENITYAVDYFSFGAIMHEYLTGCKLYPKAKEIYNEEGHVITKRYMEYLESGRENIFQDDRFPEIHNWIDGLTTFDSTERMKRSPNLFALAHRLREEVNALGFRDVNTDFLWNQLNEYGKRTF